MPTLREAHLRHAVHYEHVARTARERYEQGSEATREGLTLFDLDGNEVSLTDFNGQVILVNNWATWCPPCREEMPEFKAYYEKYQDQGFQIVAVEAGQPEAEVRAFVEAAQLEFVILLDPQNISLRTFQHSSLPNSWVIDREGNLRLAWLGSINGPTLEKYVTPLLEE